MGKMGMARDQLSGWAWHGRPAWTELACWDAGPELELNCMLCGAGRPYMDHWTTPSTQANSARPPNLG